MSHHENMTQDTRWAAYS